jgi:glycosyltransferase involved in cell wall biosynthesis
VHSLLSQTWTDLELIISDNGSTDRTEHICRFFAARDRRVRYYRSETNQGAAPNFNHLVQRARGRYFKWAAHDDLCAPAYLEQCMAVLEAQPDVACCHSISAAIDENNEPKGIYAHDSGFDGDTAAERFEQLLTKKHICATIFGVMRTEWLRGTPLLQPYVGSDRNLLAEIALMGKIHVIPKPLFSRRDHPGTSVRRFVNNEAGWVEWFDPKREGDPVYPMTETVQGYRDAILRVLPEGDDRQACLAVLEQWIHSGTDYQNRPVAAQLAAEASAIAARQSA